MNKLVDKIINNVKYQRLIVSAFFSIVLFIIIFLCTNLYLYYKNNVVNSVDSKLFYEFVPNTIAYNPTTKDLGDISEQFLSYKVSYGIDVSEWQGNIDWNKVASTGISFVMIRCGFRQTSGSEIIEDAKFRTYIDGAKAANLKVGVYFFGTAKNEEEALEEANFTLNLIKDYDLTYPVVYDAETFDTGRLTNVSYSQITKNILTFTETIESFGYTTMVYSNRNAFMGKLDTGLLDGKLIWLAHYTDETDYTGNFNMWQYSSEGKVDGINTNVDVNISYFNYVDNEKDIVDNPNYKKAPEVNFETTDEEVVIVTKATMRCSATTGMPNKLGTLNYGTKLVRTGISANFSKVLYNGRVVYILNSELRRA